MQCESEDDPANEADEDIPSYLHLSDSDSEDESIHEERSASSSDEEYDREVEEPFLETILAKHAKVACPRANIKAEYGQELYLSDIPGDEAPSKGKVAAIRKQRSKVKPPRFVEWVIIISYDPDEDLVCSTEYDKQSDFHHVPSMDEESTVLCEVKQRLNNTEQLPDTQMVRESTLPFPRECVWALARAIGRARAVYIRFLYLISELEILEGYETAQYADILGAEGLRNAMVNTVMPLITPEFFFFLEENTKMLFVCNVDTIKRLWKNDTDVRNEQFINYVARPKSIDEWWLYNDVHNWVRDPPKDGN